MLYLYKHVIGIVHTKGPSALPLGAPCNNTHDQPLISGDAATKYSDPRNQTLTLAWSQSECQWNADRYAAFHDHALYYIITRACYPNNLMYN